MQSKKQNIILHPFMLLKIANELHYYNENIQNHFRLITHNYMESESEVYNKLNPCSAVKYLTKLMLTKNCNSVAITQ